MSFLVFESILNELVIMKYDKNKFNHINVYDDNLKVGTKKFSR